MAMGETFGVEIDKDIESGIERVTGFFGRERALGKNLGQIFLGVFHDRVEEILIADAATAGVIEGEQVGVSEMSGMLPERQSGFGAGRISGNEFDDCIAGLRLGKLGQVDRAVIRGSEKLTEEEFTIDRLAFPLIPLLVQGAPHRERLIRKKISAGVEAAETRNRNRRSV